MATTPHATPSRDPADDGTLLGMLREVLRKQLQATDDMLPAQIVSYDRATNRAQVQPLIRLVTTDNRQLARAPVASVPVMQFGGGGFVLSFNLQPGNLGWIKASDRDISLFLQTYGMQAPNSARLHSFSDAVFIPDVMTGYTLAGEDADNAVLQTLDGSVKVALGADQVKLAAGAASFTLSATQAVLDVSGAGFTTSAAGTVFAGPVTMPAGATISGVPFGTHKHAVAGIQTGAGTVTSGGPTP